MKIWLMNHYATSMYRDKAGRHYWFAKKLEKETGICYYYIDVLQFLVVKK